MMMSKNLLAFAFFAALGALGSACASGEETMESEPSTTAQASTEVEEADEDSADKLPTVAQRTVPSAHLLSSDARLANAPTPQPWNEKK